MSDLEPVSVLAPDRPDRCSECLDLAPAGTWESGSQVRDHNRRSFRCGLS